MDREYLFKRLTNGVKFDKQKFLGDALKLQIVKAEGSVTKHLARPDAPKNKRKLNSETEDEVLVAQPVEKPRSSKAKKISDAVKLRRIHQENVNRIRNANKIHIWGSDLSDPLESFDTIPGISSVLLQNINRLGYQIPTAVQMQAIPIMLQGREILVSAPTGSGKTAAFLIPLIITLDKPKNVGFRALILSPTRELAKQIYRECQQLAENTGLKTFMIDKKDVAHEKFKKTTKCDILVTTPNRLVYLVKQEAISLKSVEHLIVDECDNLFEEGFQDQLGFIYSTCDSAGVKRSLFSATCAFEVEQFCRTHLDNFVTLCIGPKNATVDLVEQTVTFVGTETGKLFALREFIRQGIEPPVLVFVQSQERANELFSELIYDGVNCDVIHSGKTQSQRERVIESFRTGKIWILICTALLSRGVDFPALKVVINYDMPASPVQYIHSVGRTGRAGRLGKAITFYTEDDRENLRRTAQVLENSGFPVPPFLLKLKKARRKEVRVPKRDHVSKASKFNTRKNKDIKKITRPRVKPKLSSKSAST